MNLLEQCLNLINSFDRAYEDIKNKMSDLQQKFFREVEDQENNYSEAVTELATELLDKMANGGFQEGDLSEESAALLQDKETVNQSISSSQLSCLTRWQTGASRRVTSARRAQLCCKIRRRSINPSRARMMPISASYSRTRTRCARPKTRGAHQRFRNTPTASAIGTEAGSTKLSTRTV